MHVDPRKAVAIAENATVRQSVCRSYHQSSVFSVFACLCPRLGCWKGLCKGTLCALRVGYVLQSPASGARHNVASVLREDALVKQKQAKESRDAEGYTPEQSPSRAQGRAEAPLRAWN